MKFEYATHRLDGPWAHPGRVLVRWGMNNGSFVQEWITPQEARRRAKAFEDAALAATKWLAEYEE